MQNCTPEEFITAARGSTFDLTAIALPSRPGEPKGVNVWMGDRHRVPDTTVWWPRTGQPGDKIVWGPNHEESAHRDIPAETLVEWVVESLEERPAQSEGSPSKG